MLFKKRREWARVFIGAKPPCAPPPSRQVELNGGCWMEVIESLPCGQFYEHQGRCYVPVRETPRPPTTVDP